MHDGSALQKSLSEDCLLDQVVELQRRVVRPHAALARRLWSGPSPVLTQNLLLLRLRVATVYPLDLLAQLLVLLHALARQGLARLELQDFLAAPCLIIVLLAAIGYNYGVRILILVYCLVPCRARLIFAQSAGRTAVG